MNHNTLKWRAPQDFARHITRNAVPNYVLGEKTVSVTVQRNAITPGKKGVNELDYDAIQTYSIRPLVQICNLKIIEFDGQLKHRKSKTQMPPFVFDPCETDESLLRAFLAEKLPNKEIESEEATREYSHLGNPLAQWREPPQSVWSTAGYLANNLAWLLVFWLALRWSLYSALPTSPSDILTFDKVFAGIMVFEFFLTCSGIYTGRSRYSLFEDGVEIRQERQTFRFLWSSVSFCTLLPNHPSRPLTTASILFKDYQMQIGHACLIVPGIKIDPRVPRQARVLALLREKLPDLEVWNQKPRNIIEIMEADKLRAL